MSIYSQLNLFDSHQNLWDAFKEQVDLHFHYLVIAILCGLANLAAEALKWKMLCRTIYNCSFFESFKGICMGICLGTFTPNRIGEFGGRIMILPADLKKKGVGLSLWNSFSQIIASLSLGVFGIVMFLLNFETEFSYVLAFAAVLSGFGILILTFFYFNFTKGQSLLEKFSFLKKFTVVFNPIGHLPVHLLWQLIALSVIKHLFFSFQFLLLYYFFGLNCTIFVGLFLILSIYFVQTILPSIALVEIGIRAQCALFFMAFTGGTQLAILSATATIWICNLMIPAIIGAYFWFRINLLKAF